MGRPAPHAQLAVTRAARQQHAPRARQPEHHAQQGAVHPHPTLQQPPAAALQAASPSAAAWASEAPLPPPPIALDTTLPTTALANQWNKECLNNFNFINTLVTNQDSNWEIEIMATASAIKSGVDVSFILITTYALFKRPNFQNILSKFGEKQDTITLIADEAHTIGAPGSVNLMPSKIINRIGLSATPERNFDALGSKAIESYFNAEPPKYTICFTMKKAIDDGILSSFNYYPKFCSLTEVELKEHIKTNVIRKKIKKP
jgi:superfamily II DNA or RNA helicase